MGKMLMKNTMMEDDKGAEAGSNTEAGSGSKEGSVWTKIAKRIFGIIFFQAIVLSAYLAFQEPINKIWGKCVVTPFLGWIHSTVFLLWSNSIPLVVLTVLLCFYLLYKGKSFLIWSYSYSFPILLSFFLIICYNFPFSEYYNFRTFFELREVPYYRFQFFLLGLLTVCVFYPCWRLILLSTRKLLEEKDCVYALKSTPPFALKSTPLNRAN